MNPTPTQLDTLLELVNRGIGRGAGELNTLLKSNISLTAPHIQCLGHQELAKAGGKPAIDTLEAGTLSEVGNTILNGMMMTLNNLLDMHLVYQVPDFHQGQWDLVQHYCSPEDRDALVINTGFEVDDLHIQGGILLLLEKRSMEEMLAKVDSLSAMEV